MKERGERRERKEEEREQPPFVLKGTPVSIHVIYL
jgi:hypothetical protein